MGKSKNNMEEKLYNLQAQQLAAQVANWAAQLDFQKERFRLLELPQFQQGLQLEVDRFAWEKAQETWERAYQEALITGMWEGQPTTQWLMDQARLTGSYNGERTLEGRLTDAQIQDMQDKMKLANDQFLAATTGYYNGQRTFDREKFEAAQALEGWKFLATLSGPQNAFKQARAIASMPGGVGQMMSAFAGQYMLPGSASVAPGGSPGGAGMLNDMLLGAGGNYLSTPTYRSGQQENAPPRDPMPVVPYPGGQTAVYYPPAGPIPTPAPLPASQGYTYDPPGTQAPVNSWNYSGTDTGSVQVYPPGVASPPQTADVSTTTPTNPQAVQYLVNYPYQYAHLPGDVQYPQQTSPTPTNGMLTPNKINAENYANAYQYQKDLLWAGLEEQGYDKGLAQEAYIRSLPQYGGVTRGSVAF